MTPTRSEFPVVLTIDVFPGPQDEPQVMIVMIDLARRFAEAFSCRTICDGSGYGDSSAPFWSIIWDEGSAYLADDCNTVFADGEGGAVRVVREIQLPVSRLDSRGLLQIG